MPPFVLLYVLGMTLTGGIWCVSQSLVEVAGALSASLGHVVALGLAAAFMDWWLSWSRSETLSARSVLAVGGLVVILALLLAIPLQSLALVVSSPGGWHPALLSGSTVATGLFFSLMTSIPAFLFALAAATLPYSASVRARAKRLLAR